eukprot:3999871-Amphidinium_carterae.1
MTSEVACETREHGRSNSSRGKNTRLNAHYAKVAHRSKDADWRYECTVEPFALRAVQCVRCCTSAGCRSSGSRELVLLVEDCVVTGAKLFCSYACVQRRVDFKLEDACEKYAATMCYVPNRHADVYT